jgi:hypothetical protein
MSINPESILELGYLDRTIGYGVTKIEKPNAVAISPRGEIEEIRGIASIAPKSRHESRKVLIQKFEYSLFRK